MDPGGGGDFRPYGDISKTVRPTAKGHNTTSNQHQPRSIMDHFRPEVLYLVCVTTLICFVLGEYLENGRSYGQRS